MKLLILFNIWQFRICFDFEGIYDNRKRFTVRRFAIRDTILKLSSKMLPTSPQMPLEIPTIDCADVWN